MSITLDHTNLHRTAKYFMDSGRAQTHDDAMAILSGFGLSIWVGQEVYHSAAHQIALLTLVNLARRTFLGGVEVVGAEDAPSLTPLAQGASLSEAIIDFGGRPTLEAHATWPVAVIGTHTSRSLDTVNGWRLTWQGWRGGVTPLRDPNYLTEDSANPLAPAIAAAACAAEAFAWHAADHVMAGRRPVGLSLWDPTRNWLEQDASEPELSYLPSRLWLIGLGNLGQAISWLLACLPYADRSQVELLLQDFDEMAESNDSTSLLSSRSLVGQKKTRVVSQWLEQIGFRTLIEERRFGRWIVRGPHDPGVALCGVDNALARSELDKPGFDLIVEAGLGAGPGGFRNFSMHSFPSSLTPDRIWGRQQHGETVDVSSMPAYDALRKAGVGACGLAQLASRTVGVPFVGLIAAALVVAELLRRLHGARGLEYVSGSTFCLDDVEKSEMGLSPYQSAFVRAR
ncbi:hypothetical protein ANOBCDAF_04424 [Pleomorphomonas sp. T1.2MG-36]|uniref:hypothetical protein n=1 Tax=Pleomorphomonas sp. T1.2MG-36 TaxID=3041167 RepID=UPI0024775C17|nr:hypothetical protein [Pleomorphomonas sp. T1.2MG-36]CAI9418943.1 hypothetical protein ANOBCDAF_04424 [Pleomorphomonas sp. T1.2MG-36]